MTDRIRTLTVRLARETREDDAEALVAAISLLSGVAEVKLGPVTGPNEWAVRNGLIVLLYPGEPTEFLVRRADGTEEPVSVSADWKFTPPLKLEVGDVLVMRPKVESEDA